MENLAIGFAGLGALIFLIAIRLPIAYAMIAVGGIGITFLNGLAIGLSQLKDFAYGQFSTYDLSVIPLLVQMGEIASLSGLSANLFRAANAQLGWMQGGVAISVVVACAGFGAVAARHWRRPRRWAGSRFLS